MKSYIKQLLCVVLSITTSTSTFFESHSTSYPFITGDTFRAFCDHIFDETTHSITKQVHDGDTIFVKASMLEEFFNFIHPRIRAHYILVSHNSDFNAPGKFKSYLDDPKIIVWFARNADIKHSKLIPIPIGIPNTYWPNGNVDNFITAMQQKVNVNNRYEDKLVYVNFAIQTNYQERNTALDFFARQPFSYVGHVIPHTEFLYELGHYKFTVSPPGGGIDCYRTWESLLMGTIPLIKHSTIDPLFENLPVVLVNDWEEVTQEFLLNKFNEINTKTYNMKKLYADYWFMLIKLYQKQYRAKKSKYHQRSLG